MTIQNKDKLIRKIALQPGKTYTGKFLLELIDHVFDVIVHDIKKEDRELGTYRGRIKDEAGVVQTDVVVVAFGNDWTATCFGEPDGYFNLSVPADKPFRWIAYDRSDDFAARYVGEHAGIPAGVTMED